VITAILDALKPLGIDHIDMPATPSRVWARSRRVQAKSPRSDGRSIIVSGQENKYAGQHPIFESRHDRETAGLQPCGGSDRTGACRLFAGQLGMDKSGRMGANAHEQIVLAFEM